MMPTDDDGPELVAKSERWRKLASGIGALTALALVIAVSSGHRTAGWASLAFGLLSGLASQGVSLTYLWQAREAVRGGSDPVNRPIGLSPPAARMCLQVFVPAASIAMMAYIVERLFLVSH